MVLQFIGWFIGMPGILRVEEKPVEDDICKTTKVAVEECQSATAAMQDPGGDVDQNGMNTSHSSTSDSGMFLERNPSI